MTTYLEVAADNVNRRNAAPRYRTGWIRVTVAQLLAMDAEPVVLVPAPGAGRVAIPILATIRGEGGTPYDQSNGNAAIRHLTADGALMLIDSIVTQAEAFLKISPVNAGIADVIGNDAIVLATDAPGAGELTDGDFDIEIDLEYQIAEL